LADYLNLTRTELCALFERNDTTADLDAEDIYYGM